MHQSSGSQHAPRAPPLQQPVATQPRAGGAVGSMRPRPPGAGRPQPRPANRTGAVPRGAAAARPAMPPPTAGRVVRPPTQTGQRDYQRIQSPAPRAPTPVDAASVPVSYTPPLHRSHSAASVAPSMDMYQSSAAWSEPPVNPYQAPYSTQEPYAATGTPYAAPRAPTPGVDAAGASPWDSFANATGMSFGGAGVMNDATAQMGMQFGRHVAAVGGQYVQRNLGALLPLSVVRHYFRVSNSYVLHKLRIILFPWRHRPWSRRMRYSTPHGSSGIMSPGHGPSTLNAGMSTPTEGRGSMDGRRPSVEEPLAFCVPREDVNSPDMYIPLMALVTYVIATSFLYGLRGRFHPEVLGYTASRALAIVFIEFCAVKLGCYLLNIQGDHTALDLLAYSGYKFVGTLVVLAVGACGFGRWVYWLTFLYMFAANAFFLGQRGPRIQFLFGIAMSQIVFGWLLILGVY